MSDSNGMTQLHPRKFYIFFSFSTSIKRQMLHMHCAKSKPSPNYTLHYGSCSCWMIYFIMGELSYSTNKQCITVCQLLRVHAFSENNLLNWVVFFATMWNEQIQAHIQFERVLEFYFSFTFLLFHFMKPQDKQGSMEKKLDFRERKAWSHCSWLSLSCSHFKRQEIHYYSFSTLFLSVKALYKTNWNYPV